MSSEGPIRRRLAWRHLDSLAHEPEREPRPGAAAAHVRVIVEPGNPHPATDRESNTATGRVVEDGGSFAATQPVAAAGPADQRVHAVPIDQPFASTWTAATRQG